jgi:prepilin-type N-terminal cleavage/methylation domain-containing protein
MNIDQKESQPAKKSGFSLIEILLVMLITSILVLRISAAFKQVHMLRSRIENNRPVYQQSRLILDTIRSELSCLYSPSSSQEQQLRPFALSSTPDGTTQLSFYTLNPAWKNTAISSYPANVGYIFSTDSQSEHKLLVRTEQLCAGEKTIAAPTKDTILNGLSEFNVWAIGHDSDFSPDSWKSNLECKQIPPKAVKVQLIWFIGNNQHDFQTIVRIPCQTALPAQ